MYTYSMKDKIKIYLPIELKTTLLKDAKSFGFLKSSGEINSNKFLNTLILHYYEEYMEKQKQIQNQIQLVLNHTNQTNELTQLFLTEYFQKLDTDKSETVTLSLKPTKQTEGIFDYIEQYLLNDSSISSYYATMLASYASLPQDRREMILFRDSYDKIKSAISQHKTIVFTTNQGKNKYLVAPYKIASSHEEIHNYMLTKVLKREQNSIWAIENSCIPFRLSKIENVMIHHDSYTFNDSELSTFSRALRNGVQFIYREDDELIKVKLKENFGTRMFDSFYVHRPIPTLIEGNNYYFDCSYDQIINYFARFGSNAIIEYPRSLAERMMKLHLFGFQQYHNEK